MIKSVKHMKNNKRVEYLSLLLIYGVLTGVLSIFSPDTVEAANSLSFASESSTLENSASSASDSNLQKIKVLNHSPTRLRISSKGINRISFAGQRLDKIIGNQESYSAVIADQGDHLFLTSKQGPGSRPKGTERAKMAMLL